MFYNMFLFYSVIFVDPIEIVAFYGVRKQYDDYQARSPRKNCSIIKIRRIS